jgi:hypothetical protein
MCVPETKFYGTELFLENDLSFTGKGKRGVRHWGMKKEK